MDRRSFVLAAAGSSILTLDWRRALAAGLPPERSRPAPSKRFPGKFR